MILEEPSGYKHPEYYELSSTGNKIRFKESYFGAEYALKYELLDDNTLNMTWPDGMVMKLKRMNP